MAKVVVYLGPVRSGKTHELLRQYRDALSKNFPRTLWLAPNARTANFVRSQLLAEGRRACLNPGVVTFDRLTQDLLADTPRPLRSIDGLLQRELLRRLCSEAIDQGKLTVFAAAASRAGFIDLLAEHFDELHRRDISATFYSKTRPPRASAQQHAELAHLFSEYNRTLRKHDLLDMESAHAAARDVLAAGECRHIQNLDLIVVDGFTDFTRIQHDILHLLAPRTTELLISLPHDAPPPPPTRTGRLSDQLKRPPTDQSSRPDLFAKVSATLTELRRHHPNLETHQLPPRPSAWPALDHLTDNIFRHPAAIPPPTITALDSLDRLEFVAAAGVQDEIVEIARRIKHRLASGEARPGEIVVVFRSLIDVAPRVRNVFDEFGIPYYLETTSRLITTPLVKTLLALLKLDVDDWPFRRVIAAITNYTLTALDDRSRLAADWLTRDLQIADGRRTLLERVDQLAADSRAAERGPHAERRAAMAQDAKPALALLSSALDTLPQQATPTQWCSALAQLAATLGLPPFNIPSAPSPTPRTGRFSDQFPAPSQELHDATDPTAWQSLEQHFTALERLDSWLTQPPRELSRRDVIAMLLDVATHESVPSQQDEVGRVRILAAPAARNISARYLYLAGMSEQAFPSPERAGRLATEADYRFSSRAADQDLAATPTDSATRSHDEMLLFYEVLSRAEESLTISYPALDDKAQSLPPSPYVLEIQRTLGEKGQSKVRCPKPHLSPVPRDANVSSHAEWRVQAIARALDGDRHLLAGLFASELPSLVAAGDSPWRDGRGRGRVTSSSLAAALNAGIRIVHARAHGDGFGSAEGLLTSPAVAARLAQRFGSQHLWSPSQWETYAACPYKFFLEGVLGLEPLGDLVLETDFARRGSRMHNVLATFHRQWLDIRANRSLSGEEEAAEFLSQLQNVIEERINAASRVGIDAALIELDRRQIGKWAAGHFDHHQKYEGACSKRGAALTPSHFEFRFGPSRPGDSESDPNSISQAFTIEINGEKIRVTGQIDRIDVGTIDGKTYFNVIDYKSGKKTSLKQEHIESGERLQLPIYVEAAQALVFGGDATPLAAGYWSMAGGFDARGALAAAQEIENGDRWQDVRDTVHRLVGQFVTNIRSGDFPVASRDDKCTSYCDFQTVCRITQIRNLNKTWSPTSTPDL